MGTKAKRRLREMTVKEISLVPAGDNPPARTVLFKAVHRDDEDEEDDKNGKGKSGHRRRRRQHPTRKRQGGTLVDIVTALVADSFGSQPDEAFRKRLFDEVREDSRRFDIEMALGDRIGALQQSIMESLFHGDSEGDPQALIKQSIEQFSSAIDSELADLFAGRIAKALEGLDEEPDSAAFEALLFECIDPSPQAVSAGTTQEVESMDLSKLNKADREAVEKAMEAAKGVAGLQDEIATLKKAAKPDEAPKNPLDDVPEDIRKIVSPLITSAVEKAEAAAAENATLKTRLEKIEASAARGVFEKGVGDLTGLPEARDVIVDRLYSMSDAEARGALQKTLEAAAEAARRGAIGFEMGSALSNGGSAYAKIVEIAKEIQKADPQVSDAIARTQAMERNPLLYDQYLSEEAGSVQ